MDCEYNADLEGKSLKYCQHLQNRIENAEKPVKVSCRMPPTKCPFGVLAIFGEADSEIFDPQKYG